MIHDVNGKTNKQIDQHANPIALRKCMGDRVQENQLYVTYHASLSSYYIIRRYIYYIFLLGRIILTYITLNVLIIKVKIYINKLFVI